MIAIRYNLLLEWFVEHVLTFKHLQQMDVSLGCIIDHLQIIIFIWLVILDIILDHAEICRVYEYAP